VQVKAKLGGRVRLLTTGASPIGGEVMAFLRVCFPGATVIEGYGARARLLLLLRCDLSMLVHTERSLRARQCSLLLQRDTYLWP
jgi:hypothetical protein